MCSVLNFRCVVFPCGPSSFRGFQAAPEVDLQKVGPVGLRYSDAHIEPQREAFVGCSA